MGNTCDHSGIKGLEGVPFVMVGSHDTASGVAATPAAGDTLSFFVASQRYSATTLSIEVSTTDAAAASFTTVLATYTTGTSGTIGTTSTDTWVEKRFPMDDYVGQDIFIAFHITDENGSAVYIDDVTGVTLHVVTCAKPATIAVSDITNEGATVSWTAGGSETQWQYVVTGANAAADWTTATTINQPSAEMIIGETVQLKATVFPSRMPPV